MSTVPAITQFPEYSTSTPIWTESGSDNPAVYVIQFQDGGYAIIGAVTEMVYVRCEGGGSNELPLLEAHAQSIADSGRN